MCGGPEKSNGSCVPPCQGGGCQGSGPELDGKPENEVFNDIMSYLLELAANDDLDGFKRAVEEEGAKVDAVGMWYSRQSGTTQMVLEQRSPAMIAALYGSLDVLKYILDVYTVCGGDINQSSETDGSTALHCAVAGGSVRALDTAKLILDFGADLNVCDLQGRRPVDVIAKFTRLTHVKTALEKILTSENGMLMSSDDEKGGQNALSTGPVVDGDVLQMNLLSFSSTSSSLRGSGHSPFSSPSPSSSPKSVDTMAGRTFGETSEKVKEYPVDPSIPDIKSSIYATDEFRMFSFKVRPCSRAYSHDWTECPFVHPGENARRRDPRRYHYSCVPCPDFRKGACRRGDACEYAHGVFECWLHPAQYRTRLCKDGTACTRRVCFFAHTTEELRPLYVSTGSAVPSPRGTSSLDMAAMSPPLAPGSPSSMLMMSPLQSSNSAHTGAHGSFATPPMSPSSGSSLTGTWSPNSVPTLHLPGVSLHASRLRAELNARDLSLEDLESGTDYDGQLNDFTSLSSQALSTQARLNAAIAASSCCMSSSRSGKYRSLGLSVVPTNLEEMFASEVASSPKSMLHDSALLSSMETQLQAYKSRLHSQLQNELHSQSGPQAFSPMADLHLQLQQAALDSQLQVSNLVHSPRQGSSFSLGSLARMSARGGVDIDGPSCGPAGLSPSLIAARAAAFARDKRSHSSRDLGAGFSISDWGSPTGTPEWGVQGDDLSKFKKSASFGFRQSDEPDLSWVQRLVKDGSQDLEAAAASVSEDGGGNMKRDGSDLSVLGTWIENTHLDQIVA